MGIFDKLKKGKGGYIFLSHSHADIERVRVIRNALEEKGFEPLCFYLKCLDDDSEIEDLIKREIDAREWFIFVDSENSRKSKWVTLEREYIKKTDKRKIIPIDINDEKSIIEAIEKILHNLRVYISYSRKYFDTVLAGRIKKKLEEKDYVVFFDYDDIMPGQPYASTITNAITEASRDGCVMALITSESVKSAEMLSEVAYAIKRKGNVIPVLVGDVEIDDNLRYFLSRCRYYRLPENPEDADIERMIDEIGYDIEKK